MVTADLISRARAGDGEAFRELTEPYRRELQVHCYRMLGSFQDSEDALQDALLAAWQGLGAFEGRASIRRWLYRIATNRCLNALRSASRRPAKEWDIPGVEPPEPTRLGEVVWLEPFPDALLEGAIDRAARPGGPLRADRGHLPGLRDRAAGPAASPARRAHPARRPRIPRQRGGRHARLDRRLGQQRPQTGPRQPAAPTAADRRARTAARRRLTRRAGARGKVRPRVRVRGHRRAGRLAHRRRPRLHATDSPRVPGPRRRGPLLRQHHPPGPDASTSCRREPMVSRRSRRTFAPLPAASAREPASFVLTLTGDRICAFTRFDSSVLPWFGLPRSLPG